LEAGSVLPSLDSATWLCETFNLVSPRDLGARQVQLPRIPPLYDIKVCTKEPGLKPNQPNHNKKVSSTLEPWLLCSGNSGDKQRVAPDLSFVVKLKVF
jgi:hypothetical protein